MVIADEPGLSVWPDGARWMIVIILCSKLSVHSWKNDLKLEDLFNSGKYDIVFESGALILKSNRHRGYYSVHCIYKFN